MKKNVESKNNKICSSNTDDSVYCRYRNGFQILVRRLGIWCKFLKKLLKFLLFAEDQPKHSVWSDFNPIHLGLVIPLSVMPSVGFVVVAGLVFGVVGFFAAYATVIVLVIEIPHCIFDR